MGCANSKEDDLPIVSLCRQRRDLIGAAADRRYDLAAAHSSYFRALDRVGDALHRFVTEDLSAAVESPSASPLLTLPPSDGKSKSKSDESNVNGDGDGNVDHLHVSSSSRTSSISLSSSGSEENADPHPHFASGSEPGSLRGFDSSFMNPNYYVDPVTARFGYNQPHFPQDEGQFPSYLKPNYYPNLVSGAQSTAFPNPNFYPNFVNEGQFASFQTPNYHYMRKSSTVPSTFYMEPNIGSYGYADYYSTGGTSMSRSERENVADSSSDRLPPPPPPAPEGSGWDFFNVFDSYEQYLMDFKGKVGPGSSSSPDSSEIREKEGIPDLEEETEPESFREVEKIKKAAPLEEVVEEMTSTTRDEKDSKRIYVGGEIVHIENDERFLRKKGVSFEGEDLIRKEESCLGSSLNSSLVTEESELDNGIALHVHGTRDVVAAAEDIKEQFRSAAGFGDEVARLLEVGKLRYRSRCKLLKVIFSRILESAALSALTSMSHSSNHVRHPNSNVSKENGVMDSDHINVKSSNLSATLEKLHAWEKRLYKEVKDEEKLRVIYEKECRRLKALDDGGAESSKIDSSQAAIRKLLTKISIAIKSVDAISRRIHKLRDEELRPQLIKLIHGLMMMWNSILTCHQKQLQAIAESKTQNLTARSRNQTSVAKATMELEVELRKWSSCFRNWIITKKAYIETLNDWLMKWLLHEQEETSDGFIPFSPSRIGAPTIFIISNDWHHTIEKNSEAEVTTAMDIFADNVHNLWEIQDKEQRQKLKADYLSRDFSRRLKSLKQENGPISIPNADSSHDGHLVIALDAMRRRLDEEKAKHQEVIKHVQEAALSSLQMGLVPIFEALRNYTDETVKAYKGLRIPSNNDEGT